MQQEQLDVTIEYNSIFREFNKSRKRYRFAKGSAGSGKSVNVAQGYINKIGNPKYKGCNLLAARKTESTNRDSTFAELQGAIYRQYGDYAKYCWKIIKSPLMIESLVTGNQIIFRGMFDERQREKIKSITFKEGKLTDIWLEEVTEFTERDIDILDDRLRGLLPNPNLFYQITGTFNPVSATHFLKSKFFDADHEDIFTHHSTYLDNRFIDAAYHRRMMMRKERDPDGYKVYGLGEWGETGGLILPNIKVHDFNTDETCFDNMYLGQDFGFNHANALLEIGWKDGDIFITKELYLHEKDTSEIIQAAEGMFNKRFTMWCDSAEPDRIKMWKKALYRAKGVSKEKGQNGRTYIQSQIDWLKGRTIHVHSSCVNTIKELQQWKWKKDEKSNTYTDEPVDVFDDAIAAIRYGVESVRKQRVSILDVI